MTGIYCSCLYDTWYIDRWYNARGQIDSDSYCYKSFAISAIRASVTWARTGATLNLKRRPVLYNHIPGGCGTRHKSMATADDRGSRIAKFFMN